jgi:hypothetical protein
LRLDINAHRLDGRILGNGRRERRGLLRFRSVGVTRSAGTGFARKTKAGWFGMMRGVRVGRSWS